jgi:type VI secretion system protein ImpA
MADFDPHALMAPLGDAQPCGPNLEYDADFLGLEAAARGRAEQQFGDTVIPAEEPDWRAVDEAASALAARTRDLRVGVTWLRARTHLHGVRGFASTLAVLAAWLEQHWDHLHPQLDPDDGLDPTMRLNALAPLADAATVLADLRAAPLAPSRGSITVREVELGLGKATPLDGESAPSEAGVLEGLRSAEQADPGLLDVLRGADATLRALDQTVAARAGTGGPELKPLARLLHTLAQAAAALQGDEPTGDAAEPAGPGAGAGPLAAGPIRSREDAARLLETACEWLERHEPANPAPILVRRAVRVMSMSFLDIVRDLAPDGAAQVERLAGTPP